MNNPRLIPIPQAPSSLWPRDPATVSISDKVASLAASSIIAARVMPPVDGDGYASLADMQAWAMQIMATPADYEIGTDYLRRWWIVLRNLACNVYLHEFAGSDDDRAMHDHPWDNTSYILFGRYIEHTPAGSFVRQEGDVVQRRAVDQHRIEVFEGKPPVLTLFITGPKVREWGFQCPQGWRHWQEFCAPGDSSQVGRGCGEHDDATDPAMHASGPVPHEYIPGGHGHDIVHCKWCFGTSRENAIIEPNNCTARRLKDPALQVARVA